MKPMKVELYNAIVADFNRLTSYSRKAENELKKKYKNLPPSTLGSIISLLVQRSMKQSYRKSPSISSKYYELYEELMRDKSTGNVILQLSDSQGISPALFARSLLQNVYSDSSMVKKCFKDTTLIEDKELAYQVFMGTMNDNQYGPYADLVKQSIGLEYELRLERELRLLNITFSDENILRSRGYDKTPDFKLDVPIAVDGFIVNWVESKALFGDEENHSGYLKDQLMAYWNRFGPGLLIYWFGYLETLDSTPEVNKMFILRTSFPKKESITQYKMDLDLLKTQTNKTAVKGADNEEKVVYNLIEEAGNKGIWIRDIRVRSNLANTQLTKVLKSLESKKVIKAASKKKVYMLFNLEPDRSISGGAWYQDQDFESEFVDILNRQCLRFLQQRADKIKNNPRGPIVGRTQSYATGAEVHKYITDLGISNVTLDVEDVITILNTLVYDGKAESSMYPDGSKVFRAIESLLPPQDSCNISSDDVKRKANNGNDKVSSTKLITLGPEKSGKGVIKRIVLSFVVCDSRFKESLNVVKSVLLFTKTPVHFVIFTDDELRLKFNKTLSEWRISSDQQLDFELHKINFPAEYAEEWMNLFSKCAAQRLFIPKLIPHIDSMIYVDTDTLFLGPADELWDIFSEFNSSHISALAVENDNPNVSWYTRFAKHPFYGKYGLNSGVMLMNLTRMRDFGWVDYVTPIMLKWKLYIPWGDQALYRAVEEYKFGSDAKDALFAMERYLAEAPPSPCELLNSSRHFEARDVFAEVLERPVDLDFDAWVEFQYGEGVFVDVGGARGQRTRRLLAGLRLQLVAHGAPVHADERQRHPEHLEHPGRVKLKIADFFGMWKLAFQDKIDQGNRIEELLGDLATDDPVPYRLRNSAQQAYMDEYQLYLVNITQKKDLPVPPEYLSLLWYFFKPHMFSKSTRVIPMLEQWIPGCGVWLITGQDPPDTNKKLAPGKADAPLPHMTIFTEFGDLNLKQKITVFKKLISWPEFEQCQFRVSMENNLPKFVTAVDEDVKTSIDAHIDDVESSDSDKLTSDWLGPEGVDCFWGSNGAALKLAAYFGMLFCFNNVLFNYLSIVNIRFIFRDFHVQVHAADPMELQALLVLGGVGVVLVAVLLLMGLFSASGTSYEEAIAQQRRATTELLALAENKNKPKKNNKKAIKKLARKEKNKENNAAATGSEVDSDVPAESGVDEDIVPPVKPHVEFCPPIIVDVPRDTPPNVKIRKRGKDPKVKPILINKEDPSCISDPSTPPSPTGSVSNHFEEIHPKDEFELLQSSLAAEKPSELTTDKLLKQALAAAPPAPAPAPAPAPSPPAVKNKKKKPEPNVLSLMGKSYLAYAHNFTQAAAAARVELHTQQARLQRVLDENQALQQDQLLLQSKLGAEEAQAQRIVQMEMHIQQLSESEVTLMAQVEAQAREAYLAQQQAAMLAQQQASAVRAAAGRRRARPRRRGPARAPRRAAAAGPPRRSRRLARQHASSTRSSWATPRAPAPTRTSARTTPSCSCRTASPVTLPQQPPAGPAARQQYAQQLGDAARARADADQRAHHAELQLQDRLAGNTPAAAAGWPGSTPAVRAAAGRRRARPRRRGPARAPRRAAAAGPPRRSRRLARQHASSTRSSWATPRAPAPTRTSARTTPSCSCRTASPVTLPQQPPAGPAARQQYAQQLGDAARARADADQRAHHAELQLQDRLAGNTPAAAAGWPGSTPASAELAKVESVVESLRNALATEQRANSEQKETLARLQEQLSQYQDKNNEAISKAQEAQYAEVANVLRLACPAAAPAAAAGRAWLLQFADNLKKEVSAAAPAPEPAPAPAPVPAAAPAADARLAELSAQNDQLQAHVDKYKRIIDETMQKKIDTLQAELQQKQAANHNHSFADSERLAEERLLTDMSEKYKVDVCNGPLQVGLEEK
ncbi:hypothetical protein MSG28_006888 [Choristoneura fumiferana]|uniref:Uncharacterized protein n=1 Tax=Choristoneura fumiferana TaxID=7141 RepID=A0ACC0JLG5_CHOFU|nr:hypothetical protein MSG28_006888 [Choristoneura fumiferana]